MKPVVPASMRLLPSTDESQPFQPFSPYQGTLAEFDYVEEEWLTSGQHVDGRPFTTTLLVRRPRDPEKFSDTVVLEPLHMFPITPIFMYSSHYIMRSGHAWAAVGSLKVSVDNYVVTSNPARYADVMVPGDEVGGDSEFNLTDIPFAAEIGEGWWPAIDRAHGAANAILAQTAAALRSSAGPLVGYSVRHVVYAGHSFTGHVGINFLEQAQATMRMADGSSVFSGFYPVGWPTRALASVDVPIVQVITEGDISDRNEKPFRDGYAGMAYRRPDGDAPGDQFRLYELAGVAHTSTQHPPVNDLDFLKNVLHDDSIPDEVDMSGAPFDELFNVTLDHLIRWVADGVVPPKADRLVDGSDGFAADEHGNTLGGVRSAHVDVPRAMYLAATREPDGARRFGAMGFERRFDRATLQRLYGDKATYLARFRAALDRLVAEGWYLAADIDEQMVLAAAIELD